MLLFSLSFSLSQHPGLFQRVSSLHQVAKVLDLQPQHPSFQSIFRVDSLYDWLGWSPCCPKNSQESSLAPQFESIHSLAFSFIYGPTHTSIHDWLLETIICAVINSFRGKICCICLQRRSLWTVISPVMRLLLVLCSSFLCLAISIRLAQLCRSAWSEPEAGLSYGAPKG